MDSVDQAECGFRMHEAASQDYVNTYSTRRSTTHMYEVLRTFYSKRVYFGRCHSGRIHSWRVYFGRVYFGRIPGVSISGASSGDFLPAGGRPGNHHSHSYLIDLAKRSP